MHNIRLLVIMAFWNWCVRNILPLTCCEYDPFCITTVHFPLTRPLLFLIDVVYCLGILVLFNFIIWNTFKLIQILCTSISHWRDPTSVLFKIDFSYHTTIRFYQFTFYVVLQKANGHWYRELLCMCSHVFRLTAAIKYTEAVMQIGTHTICRNMWKDRMRHIVSYGSK